MDLPEVKKVREGPYDEACKVDFPKVKSNCVGALADSGSQIRWGRAAIPASLLMLLFQLFLLLHLLLQKI